MLWTASESALGFTGGKPWLPLPAEHREKAVENQPKDRDSVLHSYRTFVHWRRGQPALSFGDIRFLDSPENTMALVREYGQTSVVAVFNFNQRDVEYDLPLLARAEVLSGHGFALSGVRSGGVRIPGYAAFFARL